MESASHTTTESLGAARPTSLRASSRSSARARTSTNTPSTIATACGSSAPTIAGATSGLVTAPVATPGREHWTELIPHRDDVMLEEVDLFAGFFVACEREDGLPRLRAVALRRRRPRSRAGRRDRLPRAGLQRASARQPRLRDAPPSATPTSRWSRPASVYEYDVATGESTLLKQLEVPGGFDRTLYASERIHATAPDGVAGSRLAGLPQGQARRRGRRESALRLRLRLLRLLAAARASAPTASACSIAAWSWPTRTSAAAATWASPGTTPARCWSSATPSPTSSPPSSI